MLWNIFRPQTKLGGGAAERKFEWRVISLPKEPALIINMSGKFVTQELQFLSIAKQNIFGHNLKNIAMYEQL